jgi:hypothetical protein
MFLRIMNQRFSWPGAGVGGIILNIDITNMETHATATGIATKTIGIATDIIAMATA